jgi:hypothetical protein
MDCSLRDEVPQAGVVGVAAVFQNQPLRKECMMLRTALLCLALLAFVPASAGAQVVNLKADLKGSNEVPPLTNSGSGQVTATFDPATRKLAWKGTLASLTATPTMAHFHGPAEATKNAGVQVTIPNPGASFSGEATLTEQQARDLMAGMWYVNIHTAAHPAGEVRGQLLK